MDLQDIHNRIPDYAYDMKANLKSVLTEEGAPGLSLKQISIIAVAAAMSTPSKSLIDAILDFAQNNLSEKEIKGAQTAHAIMSMTNVYYRFLHISDNKEYKRMPPHLAMAAETKPGIPKVDFHLASIGVSAINYCKACIDFHELAAQRMGISSTGIQSAVRIAAVINAVGQLTKF